MVHAGWNLLLSGEADTHAASAVAVAFGALAFAPIAVIAWRVDSTAIPYVAASSLLEVVYLGLLATAYGVAAMGFVYPIARGSAPVIVLVVGLVALGATVSALSALGVMLVAGGVVLVQRVGEPARRRDLMLALGVGACIAAYTLVDQRGIRHADPLAYLELVFGLVAIAYVAGTWRARGPAALRKAASWRVCLAGVGFFGSYALTLLALRLAPAAAVAAVRECSVLIAVIALVILGRERFTTNRVIGAAAVTLGIACIALG